MVAINPVAFGSSREEIVHLLRGRGRVSVDELALELGVTKQCVRKHLDILEREGYVQHAPERGERGLNTVFCGCAGETVSILRPQLARLGFDARVRRLTELLGEMGYEAEAEKLPDGSYLLTEWNCPQAEVARDYRQLCDRELIVYRDLLGAEVFRESRIAGGASRCAYRVLRPKKSRG